jgi:hypothetical protein
MELSEKVIDEKLARKPTFFFEYLKRIEDKQKTERMERLISHKCMYVLSHEFKSKKHRKLKNIYSFSFNSVLNLLVALIDCFN